MDKVNPLHLYIYSRLIRVVARGSPWNLLRFVCLGAMKVQSVWWDWTLDLGTASWQSSAASVQLTVKVRQFFSFVATHALLFYTVCVCFKCFIQTSFKQSTKKKSFKVPLPLCLGKIAMCEQLHVNNVISTLKESAWGGGCFHRWQPETWLTACHAQIILVCPQEKTHSITQGTSGYFETGNNSGSPPEKKTQSPIVYHSNTWQHTATHAMRQAHNPQAKHKHTFHPSRFSFPFVPFIHLFGSMQRATRFMVMVLPGWMDLEWMKGCFLHTTMSVSVTGRGNRER